MCQAFFFFLNAFVIVLFLKTHYCTYVNLLDSYICQGPNHMGLF